MTILDKVRGKPWLRRAGYSAFFSFMFYAGLYLTFPYDALRDRIESEAQSRLGLRVEVDEVRLAGLTGVTLSGIDLFTGDDAPGAAEVAKAAAAAKSEEAKGGEDAKAGEAKAASDGTIHIDSFTAQADLLSLVTGHQAFTFDADAWGGHVDGRIAPGKERVSFEVNATDVDLGKSPVQPLAGLDLEGTLASLAIDVSSESGDLSKAKGEVVIQGSDLTLKGGEVQHFELPRVVLGTLDGKIAIEDGKAKTDHFEIKGQDLQADLDATIRLASRLSSSTIKGKLRLKPSDEWWNKNEMLKSAANFALPAGKDGWRALNLYGQLRHPGFRPVK